jgi:hypothetical protein
MVISVSEDFPSSSGLKSAGGRHGDRKNIIKKPENI